MIFSDCQEIYEPDKPQFLSFLQQHIDLDEIVPASFWKHFYKSTGKTRKYPLNAFLWTLIIQWIFSIPTDSLPLVFLRYSRHLREFCGFDKVPDMTMPLIKLLTTPCLPMKPESIGRLRSGVARYKFICPQVFFRYPAWNCRMRGNL